MNKDILKKYAELVLTLGVNMQKGQGVEIICPVEKKEIAEIFTETAFTLGARDVNVRWEDQVIDKLNFLHGEKEFLAKPPKWKILQKDNLLKNNYCYIAIDGDDPSAFSCVPPEKLAYISKGRSKAFKKFSDEVMKNGIRWCVVSVPTLSWAKQVFKDSENPEEELWRAIIKTMRLDKADPIKEWKTHVKNLEDRAEFLNSKNFEYLHFKNGIGTDIKIGLAQNHVWLSAKEKALDGIPFIANMPTEEVFTAPHNKKIDGVVKSALPLSYNGQIIDNFTVKFKKGKVVSLSAEKGEETLKKLIQTDNGTKSLGEVALIGKNSPISEMKILFFNTLFDENASCHLAFGKAYPTTVKNGDELTAKQLSSLGVNESSEHVDFMIGTPDLKITGISYSGEETEIFKNGECII